MGFINQHNWRAPSCVACPGFPTRVPRVHGQLGRTPWQSKACRHQILFHAGLRGDFLGNWTFLRRFGTEVNVGKL